MIKVLAQRKWL